MHYTIGIIQTQNFDPQIKLLKCSFFKRDICVRWYIDLLIVPEGTSTLQPLFAKLHATYCLYAKMKYGT